MSGPEQRIHARVHVSTKIEVKTPTSGKVEAELRDLSKGGARVITALKVAEPGDALELYLTSLDGREIIVEGQVIRHAPSPAGHSYAVRFDEVDPAMQQALLDLLEVLLSTAGGGGRAHPRVARRLEIRFGQIDDLRAILEDISQGGLLMTVPQPLVLYEEVDVTVPDLAGGELLILHARIVNQRVIKTDGEPDAYRVGLEFGSVRPEALACLKALLSAVAEVIP